MIMKKLFIVPVLLVFVVAGGSYYFISKKIMTNKGKVQSAFITGSSEDQLIDVREFSEYQKEHLSGAVNIPLSQIRDFDITELAEDQKILVYCQTGSRADIAVTMLRQRGFKNVSNLGSLDSAKAKFEKVCSGAKVDC